MPAFGWLFLVEWSAWMVPAPSLQKPPKVSRDAPSGNGTLCQETPLSVVKKPMWNSGGAPYSSMTVMKTAKKLFGWAASNVTEVHCVGLEGSDGKDIG